MLRQKSDDGPHTAVKTQCNNTHIMAVLSIIKCLQKIGQSSSYHPATICISVLGPILYQGVCLLRTAVIYHIASIWPFKVLTAASTIVMLLCGPTQQACLTVTYISVLLPIPSRNFSFIKIAVLPIHYAACQPLQLSPHQQVHPQVVVKLPLEQPSNVKLLCLP
jgi:hypothetical protein